MKTDSINSSLGAFSVTVQSSHLEYLLRVFYLSVFLYCIDLFPERILSSAIVGDFSDTQASLTFAILLIVLGINFIGIRNIGSRIALWFLANMVMDGATVESRFFIVTIFWLMFCNVSTNRTVWDRLFKTVSPSRLIPGWPILLLGINIGLHVFTAGITKSVDPLWREGFGIYYTFLLPWVSAPSVDFIRDIEFLLVSFNYVAILVELLFLPLFLFSRTRGFSIVLFLGFALQLNFPLRIGFIGVGGLLIAFFLILLRDSSGRSYVGRLLFWTGKSSKNESGDGAIGGVITPFVLTAAMFVLCGVELLGQSAELRYPRVPSWLEINQQSDEPAEPVVNWGNLKPIWFEKLNLLTVSIKTFTLFSSHHLLGISAYRVAVVMDDGRRVYPLGVFDENCRGGYDSNGFDNRKLQAAMYTFSTLPYLLADSADSKLSAEEQLYFTYYVGKVSRIASSRVADKGIKHFELEMRAFDPPERYSGDFDQCGNSEWVPVFSLDKRFKDLRLMNVPRKPMVRIELPSGLLLSNKPCV